MANSITGVNDDIIAMSALEAFCATLTPLNAFSTNFSADAAKKGDKVSILRTIAADAATNKTTHTAYTIQDADSDAVEIPLGQPKYVSWGLDDVEIASSSVLGMETYGKQKGFQLAKAVLQDIWSEITNANFGAAAFTGAATTFDVDDVADIKDACDDADMPEEGRSLILSNAYYTALLKDAGIQASDAFGGSEGIRQGMIPNLMGFNLFRSNLVPANAENLVGFAAHPGGLGVGMRYLQPQEGNTYNRAEALVDPESGLTIGLRDWYSNDTGVRNRVLECVYGFETGVAAGLKRMVSA
jgi:hypothetical protein